jgi:hypothetical protein
VPVARIPSEIPGLVAELLQRRRTRQKNGAAKRANGSKGNGKAVRPSAKVSMSRALTNGRGVAARSKKKLVAAAAPKPGGRAVSPKKRKKR